MSLHLVVAILDFVLLGYFGYIGWRNSNKAIMALALAQFVLLVVAESLGVGEGSDFVVDSLAVFMMAIINFVGIPIALYAIVYMRHEEAEEGKKRFFLGFLWFFLLIMNLLVASNNLLFFFFFFEITTLSSYILIKFRGDEVSVANALNALKINQIGGVFLLLGIITLLAFDKSIYLDEMLRSGDIVGAGVVLLALGAMVKGAVKPFESWLLGAMVAPTPVSALLHSATMVKIAPFFVLKLSPLFTQELSLVVGIFGMFLYVVFAIEAMSKNIFKEVLAYSTVSMLALMIAMASMGDERSFWIVLYLMFFHAIAKAILFMAAGVLEKIYHIKSIDDFDKVGSFGLSMMVVIGFATITLPPFGLFFAKLFVIDFLSVIATLEPLYLVMLVLFVMGSSAMVLLYFKVTSLLLVSMESKNDKIPFSFLASNYFLFALLGFSMLLLLSREVLIIVYLVGIFLLLSLLAILAKTMKFRTFKVMDSYAGGEHYTHNLGQFYFTPNLSLARLVSYLFLAIILIVGVL